jgi:hypothetical protein
MKMPCRVTDVWDKEPDLPEDSFQILNTHSGFQILHHSENPSDISDVLFETYAEAYQVVQCISHHGIESFYDE